MSNHWLSKVKPKQQAEQGIKTILAKLAAGPYRNSGIEEADRKMLEIYLRRL